jgi:transcription elongation factor SPT5
LDSAEAVTVKLVPRLDPPGLEPTPGQPKRKKNEIRASQKLFSHEDYQGQRDFERRDGGYYYQNEYFTKEGYLEKIIKVQSLQTENVNPSLEEVTMFSNGGADNAAEDVALLGAVAAASVEDFQTGETVQVMSGELANVQGTVQTVQNGVVTIIPDASLGFTGPLEFPAKELRKKFSVGDHVKVATGVYKDKTGLVVNVDGNVATILSDSDMRTLTVFTKDLKTATEITTGEVVGSMYAEDDLVELGNSEAGVVLKVTKDNLTVLDQDGRIVNVRPQQVRPKTGDPKKVAAADRNGLLFFAGHQVQIIDGPPIVLRKKATVLYVFRKHVFLKSLEIPENRGIYVTTTDHVAVFGAVPQVSYTYCN